MAEFGPPLSPSLSLPVSFSPFLSVLRGGKRVRAASRKCLVHIVLIASKQKKKKKARFWIIWSDDHAYEYNGGGVLLVTKNKER